MMASAWKIRSAGRGCRSGSTLISLLLMLLSRPVSNTLARKNYWNSKIVE